eukprot:CAMPEP_0206295298 /NCGR_PEP_ID=MMETSP0106_2-20121207/5093_1 /ASSEMBLY_ACC=CAM_ASM_000206 /TAXON_ID=81532 /ORGANISM="Acanthoeca-like sp., Strain 10tr" /LENGTH=580 /DNA_ID=CAMNT_0053725945 /DNA_START=6 /DNA_END=1748 /DNA_ORIENTATION=+
MAAMVAVALVAGSQTSALTCSVVSGSCYTGSQYKLQTISDVTDPSVCCTRCNQTVGCTLWQIAHTGCILRNGFSSAVPGNCTRSDGVGPTPPPSPPPPPAPPAPPVPPPLGYKPNIIFFLADDYGHYNMGWRGNKEARTPNMDTLVADGIILDRHYVYQYCSPTRSSLLSGRLPIHVNTENTDADTPSGVDIRMTTMADKLQLAGYYTAHSGKWHAGGSCTKNLPVNRGFNKSIGYLSGAEDHYTQRVGRAVDLWEDDGPAYGKNGTYGGYTYTNHTLQAIASVDADTPLFIYHAWQECHTPNEVDAEYLQTNASFQPYFPLRQVFEGMAHFMDSHIGTIVDALKAKNMFDKTLIVFSSDNGGREDKGFGGNNYPLRGMKFTDFEGGTRVAAWASGGVIPQSMRGTSVSHLIHICDWYGTFAYLAGVDPVDHAAAAAALPPIDSHNTWPILSQNASSGRTTIVLSSNAIIQWPYKLVQTNQGGKGWWTSTHHPNASQPDIKDDNSGCPNGCVFNIESDPSEYTDLSATVPAVKANLTAALGAAMSTRFQVASTPGYTKCVTAVQFELEHEGFLGPICSKG